MFIDLTSLWMIGTEAVECSYALVHLQLSLDELPRALRNHDIDHGYGGRGFHWIWTHIQAMELRSLNSRSRVWQHFYDWFERGWQSHWWIAWAGSRQLIWTSWWRQLFDLAKHPCIQYHIHHNQGFGSH